MTTWIAMLRGVNVGGHNKLPMAEFRGLLAGLGYGDPKTYIQSGNAVFGSDDTPENMAGDISGALKNQFGFELDVVVLTATDLVAALAANPFPQAADGPTQLHLFFFQNPPVDLDLGPLKARAKAGEDFRLINGVFYFYTPNGYGRSQLAGKLPALIKNPMTARNLRSCLKIAELAGEL